MAMVDFQPWARFFAGLLAGCWLGAVVASAGVLLLVGRRIRHLEKLNLLLRARLRMLSRPGRLASGFAKPALVMPLPDSQRRSERPARIISIH
jgi:hypothetical protein